MASLRNPFVSFIFECYILKLYFSVMEIQLNYDIWALLICQNQYWRMAIQTNEPEPPLTRNDNKINCRLITSFHRDEQNITKTQGWWFTRMSPKNKNYVIILPHVVANVYDTFVCGKHIFWRMSVFVHAIKVNCIYIYIYITKKNCFQKYQYVYNTEIILYWSIKYVEKHHCLWT